MHVAVEHSQALASQLVDGLDVDAMQKENKREFLFVVHVWFICCWNQRSTDFD